MNHQTSPDVERQNQINEGARLSQITPRVKRGYLGRKEKVSSTKPIQAPKGHEAFLKALETSNAMVRFEFLDDAPDVVGLVKCSDKYTISIKVGDETHVLFKHSLRKFVPLTPRPETDKREGETLQ